MDNRATKGSRPAKGKPAGAGVPACIHEKSGGGEPPLVGHAARTRAALLFLALGGHRLEREAQKFADAGVLLTREAFQGRTLIVGDAHRNLAVRIARRLALVEIVSGDGGANDLTRGGEAMPFAAGLDSRDERFGKIKRERGRRLARCFGHRTIGLKRGKADDTHITHSQRLGRNEKFQDLPSLSDFTSVCPSGLDAAAAGCIHGGRHLFPARKRATARSARCCPPRAADPAAPGFQARRAPGAASARGRRR